MATSADSESNWSQLDLADDAFRDEVLPLSASPDAPARFQPSPSWASETRPRACIARRCVSPRVSSQNVSLSHGGCRFEPLARKSPASEMALRSPALGAVHEGPLEAASPATPSDATQCARHEVLVLKRIGARSRAGLAERSRRDLAARLRGCATRWARSDLHRAVQSGRHGPTAATRR